MENGRPSDYTEEICKEICKRIMEGQSVREIGRSEDMPHQSTIFRWLADNEVFQEHYARAKGIQAEMFAEEIIEIADDSTNDFIQRKKEDGSTVIEADQENIQRSRLRIDSRKWIMGKQKPKKYGDKTQHTGPNGDEPIQTETTFIFKPVSKDD